MSGRQRVTVRDLVEEAKKRVVILAVCVVGLSYLMSLTSSSVLVNLPAAATLIILLRYFSLDFEMRRKASTYKSKPATTSTSTFTKPPDSLKVIKRSDWRRKVGSPIVEDAMDQFTRHLISEWVTDLWYSRLTPDRQGPEELVQIINGVLGELSYRMRKINLIDLLTRDLIDLISAHLEHFRANQAKIEKQQSGPLTLENRDIELKRVLAAENKLHPALFSSEAEHKVLQHLMDGLISLTFRPEDLQCLFFRYIVRELLACAVMRPVLNLATPRFINERIESVVISVTKAKGATGTSEDASQGKANGSSRISSDHFSKFLDPSITGVELVQLKSDKSKTAANMPEADNASGISLLKDPLLSMDTRTSRSWNSLPSIPSVSTGSGIKRLQSGGEWGNMLDIMSRRKTEALAPENFENMWAKGRNYKKKEDEKQIIENLPKNSSLPKPVTADCSNMDLKPKQNFPDKLNSSQLNDQRTRTSSFPHRNASTHSSVASYRENDELNFIGEEDDLGSSSSYTSQDEETGDITGLDAPGTKVWDGRSNRNSTGSQIHHPLENSEGHKRSGRKHMHYQRISRIQKGRNRSRFTNKHSSLWQEGERTSFLSGDGQDILMALKEHAKGDDSSDDSEFHFTDRIHSQSAASSATSVYISQNCTPSSSLHTSFMVDSFFKLRCEVLGANIVKSGSKTFAVYSISVTEVNNNNSWSIKRRFRHFEELHRRLKEFSEYNLHLPPKHFLSTGSDVPVIQERCKLLDRYLKELLQLPKISGSIEVWDFLSVDSQTYVFSNSFSIMETLSVDLDDKPSEKSRRVSNIGEHVTSPLRSQKEHSGNVRKESTAQIKDNHEVDELRNAKDMSTSTKNPSKEQGKSMENGSPSESVLKYISSTKNIGKTVGAKELDGLEDTSGFSEAANDPTLPAEWVPPNLSVPILYLVDVVFQLQEGGWIRRKAFWVAKQILQLGMGDALDDWLIEKIQLLRKGSVVASGIRRVEQILWPDGIFLTKHPRRQQRPPSSSPSQCSPRGQQTAGLSSPRLSDGQLQEAERRANFVYELIIDGAPAPVVSLVGRKEYEQCAKDLYFFLQSTVCMKQLAFELLELLLLSAFPEMDHVFKQLHEEKYRFGEFKEN